MRRVALTLVLVLFSCLCCPGEKCKHGRFILRNLTGIISDGDKDYPAYARCEWLIEAPSPYQSIYLEFESLKTECSYDFLFIYDGDSYLDPMLASLSGNNHPEPIVATSGKMLVYLFSDRNYEQSGFFARYQIQDCPLNCSERGSCIENKCICRDRYTGVSCERELCPGDCGENGNCTQTDNSTYCQCQPGYTGYMCNISLNDANGDETWYEVAPKGTGFTPRSAHAGTMVPESNCLYIFGGFTFNAILDDLMKFCLDTNQWEVVPKNETWPAGRYEHAVALFDYGFYMFGGIIDIGKYGNDLWYFNASTETWTLCADNSTLTPIGLSGHTLTVVENEDIYLFGGKSSDGRFWSNMYKISGAEPEQWELVEPLGGKSSERRLVGHSTVYHTESKSLLIYGGYSHSPDQPRYGSHTRSLHAFHIENRIWSWIRFEHPNENSVPQQRSFHSAQIMGNYMIVYGGNTHKHHDHELCYDYEMYLYHLGCHTWVRIGSVMKKYYGEYYDEEKQMMRDETQRKRRQGRVSHVAAAAYGNMLLVVGGYSGYLRGDLIAFKFPPHVAPPDSAASLDLDYCMNFNRASCSINPDCFYCNNITTNSKEGCMHRSMEADMCRERSNFYPRTECPGICGLLGTCLECLSQGQGASLTPKSPQRWTYIQPCNWCVKEGRCQQRSIPNATCLNGSNTPSGVPGWWGGRSASLSRIDQCHLEDFPAGLQAVKYRPVVDYSMPDEVQIIRETKETEKFRHIYVSKSLYDQTRWMGFIHPLNATVRILVNNSVIYTFKLLAEKVDVMVGISKNGMPLSNETVARISKTDVAKAESEIQIEFEQYPNGMLLFPNRTRGNRYYLNVRGSHQYPAYSDNMSLAKQMYKIELKWNGCFPQVQNSYRHNRQTGYRMFSYEFLEPFSEGTCNKHSNCLACMLDTLCGWCDPEDRCVLRNSTEGQKCRGSGKEKMLITEPSVCPVCPDYVDCQSCASDPLCEWMTQVVYCVRTMVPENDIFRGAKMGFWAPSYQTSYDNIDPLCEWVTQVVYCVRRGRAKDDVVRNNLECPPTCHERTSCSKCLNLSECAWCENLRTCLPFSDYVSRHRHGQCTEWIDSETGHGDNPHQCRNCSSLRKCDECLKTFNCGWCGNKVNPTIGVCSEGDFNGPYGNSTCTDWVGWKFATVANQTADWSYSTCPDVEECLLGLDNCHNNATCTNTPTAFNCTCNKGFTGDGIETCEKTCYHACAHGGLCMEDEDTGEFYCDCDLGWTGEDCGKDCGCNKHSMCTKGPGFCDMCLNNTTGLFCDQCLDGYYGDPAKPEVQSHGNKPDYDQSDSPASDDDASPDSESDSDDDGKTPKVTNASVPTSKVNNASLIQTVLSHGHQSHGKKPDNDQSDSPVSDGDASQDSESDSDDDGNTQMVTNASVPTTKVNNASLLQTGCSQCKCNGHGDKSRRLCHNISGECFCMDNTEGYNCERCEKGYYGHPRNGGKCYLSCDHGLIIKNFTRGSVGSHKGPGVSTWRSYCLWIFDTSPNWHVPSITFGIEDLAVECEIDHVYVYDGIPTFIDEASDGRLIGVFCGFYTGAFKHVTANSGILTIYFDADISGNVSGTQGFNGSYFVNKCQGYCDTTNNQQCYDGACTCKDGYEGFPMCVRKCDLGCYYVKEPDACVCEAHFGHAKYLITTWDFPEIHGTGPVSRYGHVLIHCDDEVMYMFGGQSLKYGLLDDIWRYSFITKTWVEIKPITNEKPTARYFHAGACVPFMKNLYIFGGMVRSPDNPREYVASKEMWRFAIDARKWSGHLEPDWVVGLAGHSMTLVERSKLVIIGGFSISNYFSDVVYIYDANSFIPTWTFHELNNNITLNTLVGIYGHSAVYNERSQTIYIYGGHVYKDEHLKVSSHLFTYDISNNLWNVLQPEPNSQLDPRYFHSAVGFDEFMVVFGGFTNHRNTSREILVYKYSCNYWFTLDLSGTEAGRVLTSLLAGQAVKYNNSIYVHGGLNHVDHNKVFRLQLPNDVCTVLGTIEACMNQPGCSAVIERDANGENHTHCYTIGRKVLTKNAVKIEEFPGRPCSLHWHKQRNCSSITNCSECVAVYPQFKYAEPSCFWCGNCRNGRCIPAGFVCDSSENECTTKKATNTSTMSTPLSHCPILSCLASTCDKCGKFGCVWSQLMSQRIMKRTGDVSRQNSQEPKYDWGCVMKNLGEQLPGYRSFMSPPNKCPRPCHEHLTCVGCLNSKGGEGGSKECYWSQTLHECMPPAYMALHCLGGECGTMLQGNSDKCPAPCNINTKCADCRRAQGCGWCAFGGENGKGACMPGTISGPNTRDMCERQDAHKEKIMDIQILERAPEWKYALCPPEDECLNGHHNCDTETQDCEDRLDGFVCSCKSGYNIEKEENGLEFCKPICHSMCINGDCVKPDRCECHFGYVGKNCSTQCECNGHSTCESVARKDKCIDCKNNTQGEHCQECKPLFVGDPVNGGRCISCREFCHNHSNVCLHDSLKIEYKKELDELIQQFNTSPREFLKRGKGGRNFIGNIIKLKEEVCLHDSLKIKYKNELDTLIQLYNTSSREFLKRFTHFSPRGSSNMKDTVCMHCQDHTEDRRCEDCQSGYFREQHELPFRPCTKCNCNGHGDECDRDSGLRCVCRNHTDTQCTSEGKGDVPCHQLQCAACEDHFLGKPVNGHHCYRIMHVNFGYCFDPDTQSECLNNPTPLREGRTVFFAVQPKFVNVDIRVIIDVTVGGIDVYFSPKDDTFIVNVDYRGVHTVQVNRKYKQQHRSRRSTTDTLPSITEVQAKDINTFITVDNRDSILIVRNVKWRLVITLPNDKLDLKKLRFYMVFVSQEGLAEGHSLGNMTFRQDQPHIDLFVFFSVFFSCFFLFLAMCVLLWKTKQGFDARRTRQQRAREMQHMASRPFAKVLVYLGHSGSPYNISPELKNRTRKVNDRTPLLPSETGIPNSPVVVRDKFKIVPIAIEPTDDGVAAIGSVVFQLPGGINVPSQLCLGSTLAKGYQLSQSAPSKFRRPLNSSNC